MPKPMSTSAKTNVEAFTALPAAQDTEAQSRSEAPQKKTSNYDQTRDRVEGDFLKYEQEKMIEKFHLKHTPAYLFINFIGREYRIDRSSGRVEWFSEAENRYIHADFNETLTIFDVLCCSKDNCSISGSFVNVNDLHGVIKQYKLGHIFYGKNALFTGKCQELQKACQRLGGVPGQIGDVSSVLPLFDFMPISLQFWDGDDEFEAVLKFMWDKNTLDFMRYETTYYAISHLMKRLQEVLSA